MAEFFKILKADPLGDTWTPNQPGAKPIQTWWCQVEGQERAVSIGKQEGNSLVPGQYVYGDLVYAKSKSKGTEYWKLKSMKVPDGVERPADEPAPPVAQPANTGTVPQWALPMVNQVNAIEKKQDEILKLLKEGNDTVVTELDIVGDPIDPETEEMLDDVFGQDTDKEPEKAKK